MEEDTNPPLPEPPDPDATLVPPLPVFPLPPLPVFPLPPLPVFPLPPLPVFPLPPLPVFPLPPLPVFPLPPLPVFPLPPPPELPLTAEPPELVTPEDPPDAGTLVAPALLDGSLLLAAVALLLPAAEADDAPALLDPAVDVPPALDEPALLDARELTTALLEPTPDVGMLVDARVPDELDVVPSSSVELEVHPTPNSPAPANTTHQRLTMRIHHLQEGGP